MMDTTTGATTRYDAPAINKITYRDVVDALREGYEDFKENRTDVLFLCLIYPLLMYAAVRLVFGYGVLPLVYPVFTGAALLGPVVAVGLYHVNWRREQGLETHWRDAFRVFQHHSIGSIAMMTLLIVGLYLAWLMAAVTVYQATLGGNTPWLLSHFDLIREAFTTPSGWALIVIGNLVGFLFAAAVLCLSVVSFPMLIDRDVGPVNAALTSIRASLANPGPVALWGLIVAILLALGSLPFLLGLAVAVPVLSHGTWHLYRKMVRY